MLSDLLPEPALLQQNTLLPIWNILMWVYDTSEVQSFVNKINYWSSTSLEDTHANFSYINFGLIMYTCTNIWMSEE